MRGTPSRRCSTRIGASNTPNTTRAIAPGREAASGGTATIGPRLLRRGLHLLVDIRSDALQSIVETHLAGHRLTQSLRGRVEQRAVVLVALELVRDGGDRAHLRDERTERRLGRGCYVVFDALL